MTLYSLVLTGCHPTGRYVMDHSVTHQSNMYTGAVVFRMSRLMLSTGTCKSAVLGHVQRRVVSSLEHIICRQPQACCMHFPLFAA